MKRSRAVLTLMMPAPPKPCRMREATSVISEPESAQAKEPSVNTARPQTKTRRLAAQFAERSERQQRDRHGELIGVDHPDRTRRIGAKLLGDGRQRDVGDRAVEHRHRKAVKTTSIARSRCGCGRPSLARDRFMRPLSSSYPLHRFEVELCRRAVLIPQCWRIGRAQYC